MSGRYALVIGQSPDTHVLVWVNGIPLHDLVLPPKRGKSRTIMVDHWLVPGENVVELEMAGGAIGPTSAVSVVVWDGRADNDLAALRWPADFAPVPEVGTFGPGTTALGKRLRSFTLPDSHPLPRFASASIVNVPPEGTPEAWAPVDALHEAFRRGDASGVRDVLEFRCREFHRYHDLEQTRPEVFEALVSSRVAVPYEMTPLSRASTRFERCADGRAYRVMRLDGLPVIAGAPPAPDADAYEIERPIVISSDGRFQLLF